MAVLDSRLRVIGCEGLRVADASALPRVTVANTMAPACWSANRQRSSSGPTTVCPPDRSQLGDTMRLCKEAAARCTIGANRSVDRGSTDAICNAARRPDGRRTGTA